VTSAWAMASLILAPLAAAVLAFARPKRGRALAIATAAVVGAAVVQLTRHVLAGGVRVHTVGGWGAPLGIDLRADGLAVFMLGIAAGVCLAITVYAPGYFGADHDPGAARRGRYFWPLFLFLWTALDALLLSSDIFNLYVTLELLSFGAVALVALAGTREALAAALRYLFISLAASLFYLLGVGLVYGHCSTVDLARLAAAGKQDPALWIALVLMTGGLMAKAALVPLHVWLPPAHANAPAPVSALLSALVVKGPFYILIRLWFEAFAGLVTPGAAQIVGVLGAAAIVWGSLNALRQSRLKLLVAYSTVAQLGYLFLLVPLALPREAGFMGWAGGLMFLGAHACAKTAMFLSAGNILHAAGHDRIADLDGMTHGLPVSVSAFALSGVSLIGLPPSGGFAGKWLLLNAALAQGRWWFAAVILAGSLLAAAYVMRFLRRAFTRVDEPVMPNPIPRAMEWTALGLAGLAVVLGFTSAWAIGLLRIGAPVAGAAVAGGLVP